MPTPRNMPCEVRVYVTEEFRERLKDAALSRSEPMSTFVRTLLIDALDRLDRRVQFRSTDPLIKDMHPLVEEMAGRMKAMSEKMGIELPEKQLDFEGENSAEKGG